ncbi:MAG TPA: DNA polymerase III subunit delta' C-terminal domain-containing protein [Nevskiales bacterium]|nr:DNA polymerase III subunit delta' C-terminal domain-containing protein [Nevskiales bacterium]
MSHPALLPWQQRQWQAVSAALAQQKLAHALLLVGPRGAGKRHFAALLAQALLCSARTADGMPCGHCQACMLMCAGTHPDLFRLEKEEGSKVLKVDDLREFNRRVFLTPQLGNGLVGIIDPVDSLNRSSANALLKSLEEPPIGARILLVGERWMSLPATLRSRCLILRFTLPSTEAAADALGQADARHGHLLEAVRTRFCPDTPAWAEWAASLVALCGGQEDPVILAERWSRSLSERLPELLDWMQGCALDVMKIQAGAAARLTGQRAASAQLRALAASLPPQAVPELTQLTLDTRRLLDTQAKPQMLLENLLASWYQSSKSKRAAHRGQPR